MGLLMPGVDKVGRYFPLTLAAPLAQEGSPMAWLPGAGPWFEQIEALALSSLRQDFSLEDFDRSLSRLVSPVQSVAFTQGGRAGYRVYPLATFTQIDVGFRAVGPLPPLHSFWWSEGSPRVSPCVAVSEGLPDARRFLAMLDGEWGSHGWQQVNPAPPGSGS